MFVQVHAGYCALDRPEEFLPVVRSNSRTVADSHDFGVHMCGNDIFACRLARFHTCVAWYCHNDGISLWLYPWCKSFLVSKSRAIYHTIRPTTTTWRSTASILPLVTLNLSPRAPSTCCPAIVHACTISL